MNRYRWRQHRGVPILLLVPPAPWRVCIIARRSIADMNNGRDGGMEDATPRAAG